MECIDSIRRALESRTDVRLAYVFGSTARGEAREHPAMSPSCSRRYPKPATSTDLQRTARPRRADLVVLNTAPPLLTNEIVKTGRCLTCRSEADRLRFETHATAHYLPGFSNVLVHDYAKVDVRRVHAGLARLNDFEAFVADVETWLARTSH
ncbi:MAG: hypothetical protein ACREKJ_14210 [Candidatus Rokuibacteriota bacterium]